MADLYEEKLTIKLAMPGGMDDDKEEEEETDSTSGDGTDTSTTSP